MDLRKTLNENPLITGVVALVVIVVGIWVAFSFTGSSSGSGGGTFYTTDDGATWFRSSTNELPPFDSGGKPAVRAYVFTCADGKEFVGYLERYSDEAKAVLAELKAAKDTGKAPDMQKVQMASSRGRLVKKPGDKDWTNAGDMANAIKVQQTKCPDGEPAHPAE